MRVNGSTPIASATVSILAATRAPHRFPADAEGTAGRLRGELRDLARDAAAVSGSEAALFFQTLDGAEMWSRWDMQDHPPDLLITNYSMLNIMLMRSIEAGIFDQTRAWLAADHSRVFHLVVDELHTYRGTAGTEVAYLLRVLLDRLGLVPESEQLRIIASSASLDPGESGDEYLEGFSADRVPGLPRKRHWCSLESRRNCELRRFAAAFRDFGRSIQTDANNLSVPARALADAVGVSPAEANPPRLLRDAAIASDAGEALRAACWIDNALVPQPPSQLRATLFPTLVNGEGADAVEGLLTCLSAARPAATRLRAHLFS